jgi:hypothetical protein
MTKSNPSRYWFLGLGLRGQNVHEQPAARELGSLKRSRQHRELRVLWSQGLDEEDVACDRNLGVDVSNASSLEGLRNLRHELLGKKINLGAKAIGFEFSQQRLVFA